ncbi:MAG: tRNA (adenine-N1)-methyltransferase [Candidatus Hydrothermarchaeaceae archaeon]
MKLLIDEKGRKHLVETDEYHTTYGVVKLSDAKDSKVKSHLGHEFSVLSPRVLDLYEKLPRAGSIILSKDIGAIIAYTGLGAGDIVVDAGTGTGGLAIVMANIVRPTGKVYTYEIREKHAAIARRNIEKAALSEYVEMKLVDIRDGIQERDVDVVTLDLPDPWNVAETAHRCLKNGGFIVTYTPYVEQTKRSSDELCSVGFKDVRSLEVLVRELEIKEVGSRPRTRMPGHTAYLTIGRKR